MHTKNYRGRVLRLARDIKIDFEAKARPVKGLTFATMNDDGFMEERTVMGGYEPEPRTLPKGTDYHVDGWWDDHGEGWKESALTDNPAAVQYMFRREAAGLPDDDEVLYGHAGLGYLLHVTEVET